MNPEVNETQPNMNGDQSAAALAFATMLQQQMMPQAPVEGEEMSENAPQQEQPQEIENEAPKEDEALKNEINDIKTDLQLIKKLLLKDNE